MSLVTGRTDAGAHDSGVHLHQLALAVGCAAAVSSFLVFFLTSVYTLADSLDVDVFDTAKQRRRAAAKAAA